jgi:hypothetical protein
MSFIGHQGINVNHAYERRKTDARKYSWLTHLTCLHYISQLRHFVLDQHDLASAVINAIMYLSLQEEGYRKFKRFQTVPMLARS